MPSILRWIPVILEHARDLYLYQKPAMRNGVRLQWGRDLYREYYRAVSNGGKDEGEANG